MSQARGWKLLRREEVEERFGVSRSRIYYEMRAVRFPEPVKIGQRAVRWRVSDLDKWDRNRPVAHGEVGPPEPGGTAGDDETDASGPGWRRADSLSGGKRRSRRPRSARQR